MRPIIKAAVPQQKKAIDYKAIEATSLLLNTVGPYASASEGNVQDKDVQFFVGPEVESTWAWKCKTLFVVGLQKPAEVLRLAEENSVAQIYFGAKKSFDLLWDSTAAAFRSWDAMIAAVLNEFELYCALDLAYETLATARQAMKCFNHRRFCPTVRIELPEMNELPRYSSLRVDGSKEGVWTLRLDDLQADRGFKFTPMANYNNDHEVK